MAASNYQYTSYSFTSQRSTTSTSQATATSREASVVAPRESGLPEDTNHIESYVRVRPWLPGEDTTYPPGHVVPRSVVEVYDDRNVSVLDPANQFRPRQSFTMGTLWSVEPDSVAELGPEDVRHDYVAQDELFDRIGRPMLRHMVDGRNTCCMTYGSANTGKTYSMVGEGFTDGAGGWSQGGILPRFCEEIFDVLNERRREMSSVEVNLCIEVTAVEVFVEKLTDLLLPKTRSSAAVPLSSEVVKVREDIKQKTIVLQNATTVEATTKEELCSAVRRATKAAARSPNRGRSHVHAVYMLDCKQHIALDNLGVRQAKCVSSRAIFADLGAGGSVDADSSRSQKALLALRRCVDLAAGGRAESHTLPYRDSVLTHLLSDVIKGTCETSFLACVSPFFKHLSDSLATLQFAARVQTIPVVTKVNEDEELSSLRQFNSEIKGLDVELLNANKSMEAVRQELEMRQIRLNDLQEVKEEQEMMLEAAEGALEEETTVKKVKAMRKDKDCGALQRTLDEILQQERRLNTEIFTLQGSQKIEAVLYEKARKQLAADTAEAERQELAQARELRALQDAGKAAAAERKREEAALEANTASVAALEAEIATLRADIQRMESDILLHKPPKGCCAVS